MPCHIQGEDHRHHFPFHIQRITMAHPHLMDDGVGLKISESRAMPKSRLYSGQLQYFSI
jgi:hypothetical protein